MVFMTDAQLRVYCARQAEEKLPFLARFLAAMPSNEDRRAWLNEFGRKHSDELAERLREMTWSSMRERVTA